MRFSQPFDIQSSFSEEVDFCDFFSMGLTITFSILYIECL